jgi:hypothetical protein
VSEAGQKVERSGIKEDMREYTAMKPATVPEAGLTATPGSLGADKKIVLKGMRPIE